MGVQNKASYLRTNQLQAPSVIVARRCGILVGILAWYSSVVIQYGIPAQIAQPSSICKVGNVHLSSPWEGGWGIMRLY